MLGSRHSYGRKIDRYRHCDLGLCSFDRPSRCSRGLYVRRMRNRGLNVKGWCQGCAQGCSCCWYACNERQAAVTALVPRFSEREPAQKDQECLDTSINALNRVGSHRECALVSNLPPFAPFQYGFPLKELRAVTRSRKCPGTFSLTWRRSSLVHFYSTLFINFSSLALVLFHFFISLVRGQLFVRIIFARLNERVISYYYFPLSLFQMGLGKSRFPMLTERIRVIESTDIPWKFCPDMHSRDTLWIPRIPLNRLTLLILFVNDRSFIGLQERRRVSDGAYVSLTNVHPPWISWMHNYFFVLPLPCT